MLGSQETMSIGVVSSSYKGYFYVGRGRNSSRSAFRDFFHFFVRLGFIFVSWSIWKRVVSVWSNLRSGRLVSQKRVKVYLRVVELWLLIGLRKEHLRGADGSEPDVSGRWRSSILLALPQRVIGVSLFLIVFPSYMKWLFHGNFHPDAITWLSHWRR